MNERKIHELIEQQNPEAKQRIWGKVQNKLKEQKEVKKWEDMTLDEKVEQCQDKPCTECEYIAECFNEFGGEYSPYFVQQMRKLNEN